MTVQELIQQLQNFPVDATVIISSGDYPTSPSYVDLVKEKRFDGYYTPGWGAKRLDCVVAIG